MSLREGRRGNVLQDSVTQAGHRAWPLLRCAAYLTGEMVWVVPTLVGGGLLASAVGSSERTATRVDEDNGGDQEDDADGEETPTGTGDE